MIIPVSHKKVTVKKITRTKVTFQIGTEEHSLKVGDSLELNRQIIVSFQDLLKVHLFGGSVRDEVHIDSHDTREKHRIADFTAITPKGGK